MKIKKPQNSQKTINPHLVRPPRLKNITHKIKINSLRKSKKKK